MNNNKEYNNIKSTFFTWDNEVILLLQKKLILLEITKVII